MQCLLQVLFIYLNIDEEDNVRILEFFALKTKDCPTYRYIQLGDDMQKYKPDSDDISAGPITSFVESILDGKRQVINSFVSHLDTFVTEEVVFSLQFICAFVSVHDNSKY